MNKDSIFIGNQKLQSNSEPVKGGNVHIEGEAYYKISNYDKMNPFFMSIVSSSDHWMFISSNGGLTAGRRNPDSALFPYYTDDVIHTCHETTGSKTILSVNDQNKTRIWEPFSDYYKHMYSVTRNIYKNIPGNKIIFEEENHDLGLTFLTSWTNSERFGFVKKSEIVNKSGNDLNINLIDGIQNILPYGIYQQFQSEFSTLADGYKKNELISDVGIGIYSMSSIPSDKAEPSESLKATSVWSTGIPVKNYLLSSRQLGDFRLSRELENESDIKAAKGAYFINSSFIINHESSMEWFIISEINMDASAIAEIENLLQRNEDLKKTIIDDVNESTEKLVRLVAAADGLQKTNDPISSARHFSNVLFNIMRGGIFDDSYTINKNDFISFLNNTNKNVLKRHGSFLESIEERISSFDLVNEVRKLKDNEFIKLSAEYLPLKFSRRHGDPSRPWNRFSIDLKDDKNEKILNYEGNWRDLFQNWEALALSFPGYIDSMITKFLNASTADGYNPYRVTRDGFDWEALEADVPWANIGYWGDHQIIYLLKLLELSVNQNASNLASKLSDKIYAYANIPYRIKSYNDLLADSQNTIDFDFELHHKILEKEREIGSDARFITNKDGGLLQVNLGEKLLVTLLSKVSNFIPGAGIWMNTQRPEWNDANNALVGNGVSMVTLYYIRRYIAFCQELFSKSNTDDLSLSEEVAEMFGEIFDVLNTHESLLIGEISDRDRKIILDGLGLAGETYRTKLYQNGITSKKSEISSANITEFFNILLKYVDHTIRSNKRDDNLYHAYNLMSVQEDEIKITHLYEMLEGQVSVLSSGFLSVEDSIKLLEALKNSSLYRKDQNSYILYPDRQLPLFIDKNIIPHEEFVSSELLKKLIEIENTDIVSKDVKGKIHFNGEIRNAKILKSKLSKLNPKDFPELVSIDIDDVLRIYESVFNHKAFTGRSGTFYKYEGLGSIYWHMVSKLVLAVQEIFFQDQRNNAEESSLTKLKKYYYDIKEGIGIHKSPLNYGAFPTDPYSHTPSFSGVQQPGMTGQVKEDIISRFGELGIQIEEGRIVFNPVLLNTKECLSHEEPFTYYNSAGVEKTLKLNEDSLAFTYCQVPFIFILSETNKINVYRDDSKVIEINGLTLTDDFSKSIFNRDGSIEKVEVYINESAL